MAGEIAAEAMPLPSALTRATIRNAARVVVLAACLGLVGQLLFFDVGLGINFPIAILLLVVAGWLARCSRPAVLDAWLGPAAVIFAGFAALRADPTIVGLDVLASLTLAGAALASFGGQRVVARSMPGVIGLALGCIGWVAFGAVPALTQARAEVPSAADAGRHAPSLLPVGRGLLIAIPIVLVFVALFSSADAVFARMVDDLFGIDLDVAELVFRAVLAAILAWLFAGGLAVAASSTVASATEAERPPVGWQVGTTELLTVLIAVDVVFAAFIALQAAYLFGGLDTMAAAGLTYAEYARRGFLELVAVAVLAGALVIGADRLARQRSGALIGSAVVLAILTGVVLVSASLRLRLYQEAYGWTELRLYVVAAMVVLAVGVIGLVAALLTDRVRWIGHALIVTTLVVGLALNLIGPVRFITDQNVARVLDPSLVPPHGSTGLDVVYATSLGDDGIPALLRALTALKDDEARQLRRDLGYRLDEMEFDRGSSAWQAWNAGRAAARDALGAAAARGEIP